MASQFSTGQGGVSDVTTSISATPLQICSRFAEIR